MPRKRKSKITRPRGGQSNAGSWGVPRPPPFRATITTRHTFRWRVATAGTFTVTNEAVRRWYVVATAATTTACPVEGIRLRRIRIWGQPPALGAALTTVELDWKGSFSNDLKLVDTSSGISPAFIDSRPPKNSSASFWFDNSATNENLFVVAAPVGSTIDVEIDMLFVDDSPAISGPSTTGATLGTMYGANLVGTGQASSSSTVPVGLTALP